MRFSLSCTAAKTLFIHQQTPILHLVDSAGRGAGAVELKRTNMFAALVRFIQQWKRYNQSLSELSRLGDRELADIGISRSDIPRLAWNAAHRI